MYIYHFRITTGNPKVYMDIRQVSVRFKLRQVISVVSLMTYLSYEYMS